MVTLGFDLERAEEQEDDSRETEASQCVDFEIAGGVERRTWKLSSSSIQGLRMGRRGGRRSRKTNGRNSLRACHEKQRIENELVVFEACAIAFK